MPKDDVCHLLRAAGLIAHELDIFSDPQVRAGVSGAYHDLKNFAKDMHVILVQETEGMKGNCYQRPPFPATWARMHDKGRVFYTSFGHREDIWTNPKVQELMLGGIAWAMGNVDADVTPNIDTVTPGAR